MIVFIIIVVMINKSKNSGHYSSLLLDHSKEIDYQRLKNFIGEFDKDVFLKNRFNDFVEIQNAWTNIDYDSLQKKLTDELYNQYQMQLQPLEAKGQKNMMHDFDYIDSMITDVSNENNQITITLELIVKFYDYLVDANNKVVRGNKAYKNTMHYEMKFVCNLTKGDTCPNCGGKLSNASSQKCEYCGSIITGVSKDWVMSKKEAKRQN